MQIRVVAGSNWRAEKSFGNSTVDATSEWVLNSANFQLLVDKMGLFHRLYDWNERTFWNSLTKKLMSFLFLFLIDLAYVAIYWHQKGVLATEIARSGANVEALQDRVPARGVRGNQEVMDSGLAGMPIRLPRRTG